MKHLDAEILVQVDLVDLEGSEGLLDELILETFLVDSLDDEDDLEEQEDHDLSKVMI